MLDDACPGAVTDERVVARIALGQLEDPFVHVEPKTGECADDDVRLRTDDLLAVLPE